MSSKHYHEQLLHTDNYIIPYLESVLKVNLATISIMEVGCAEGGTIRKLSDYGARVQGIELEPARVELALDINPDLNIEIGDITDKHIFKNIGETFDLIIIRDVIEHILDKQTAFGNLARLLKTGGTLYITFPPLYSPFAGHQQHAKSLIAKGPYIYLLPLVIFRWLCKSLGESDYFIQQVLSNYHNGLSINSFIKMYNNHGFINKETKYFLMRPIFKTRFGLNIVEIPNIHGIRGIIALGCESILVKG